jgi:excisionase family DNA binding protein
LHVHHKTVRRWITRGWLPAQRAGRRILIRTADVDAFIESVGSGRDG